MESFAPLAAATAIAIMDFLNIFYSPKAIIVFLSERRLVQMLLIINLI